MSEKPEISTEELLDSSPFKGDLDAELAPQQPKMKLPGLTLWLGAAVIAVVGFLAGTQADQAWGSKDNASNTSASPRGNAPGGGQFPGGGYRQNGQGGGFGGGGAGGGGFTAGTVVKVEGDTVFLKTADGKTVQVKTTGTTQIRITKDGKATDLKAGSTVTVRGETGSDGSMTATAVTEGGGAGGFGRGGQQQPPGN